MYDLNKDEILLRTHYFEVIREEVLIKIKVGEVISGGKIGKCSAAPELPMHDIDKALFSEGDTVEEALPVCIKKIKGLPIDKIFRIKEFGDIKIPAVMRVELTEDKK